MAKDRGEAYIVDYVTYHFHNHEVCLSFYDDKDAEEFKFWWNRIGKKRFLEWLNMPEFKITGV